LVTKIILLSENGKNAKQAKSLYLLAFGLLFLSSDFGLITLGVKYAKTRQILRAASSWMPPAECY